MRFHLYLLVSSSQLGVPALDSAQKAFCVQVVLVAKACPTVDIECFSLYLIVYLYLNAFAIVCSAPLCDFENHH